MNPHFFRVRPGGRMLALKAPFAFLLLFLLFAMPQLRTDEIEPLVGGLFKGDLTVDNGLLGRGEPLSVEEVTKLGVLRNLDMRMARFSNRAERYEEVIAESVYDTEVAAFFTYDRDQSQKASVVFGDRQIAGLAGVSMEKYLPTGTWVQLEAGTQRTSTNSAFTTLPRYYESYGEVEVRQSLLRNAFGFLDRKRIRQAGLHVRQFDLQTLDEIENSLAEIRAQYWDLKFAHENLGNSRKALRKAQDFYQITRDKLDIGLTEKPDVFAAEANVRKRVIQVLQAENHLKDASMRLKVLLDLMEIPMIFPAVELRFDPLEIDFQEMLGKALQEHRGLKRLRLALEERAIEEKIRSRERLPELVFEGRYASTSLDRDMASSQGEAGSFNHPQYFAGLRLEANIENRRAESRFEQAGLLLKRAEEELRRATLEVSRELDQSYRQLLLAGEQVRQSREIEALQHKKLLEEEKNFNRGRSSSKTIIDFQEDLIEAETEAVRAMVDYEKSVDRFYHAANRLLQKAGVVKPRAGDHPKPLAKGGSA